MDHHCVRTGNCVGYLTFKPFMLFNLYVAILMIYQINMMSGVAKERNMDHISIGSIVFGPAR